MAFSMLDPVVVVRDLPEHGLRAGDRGAIVEVYDVTFVDVEFVTGGGRTQASVTLDVQDLHAISDDDVVSVRKLHRSA